MNRKEHITGFYLETLLLIVVFIGIILVLTQIFGLSRRKSQEAKEKTSAVSLSQNAAEAFSGAQSSQELLTLLNENDNASLETSGDNEGLIRASYNTDMTPAADGDLVLELSWTGDRAGNTAGKETGGFLRKGRITVRKKDSSDRNNKGNKREEGETPVYTLETSAWSEGGWK